MNIMLIYNTKAKYACKRRWDLQYLDKLNLGTIFILREGLESKRETR